MTKFALLIFFFAAAALRFAYPLDFEYKYDQIYLFEKSQSVGVTEPWPALGMSSGVGTKNPPLSLWIFPALARLTGSTTPEALTAAQIALNLFALACLGALILRSVPGEKREPWIWAFGIVSMNWHQVFYDRVLWSQSVLPLFCVAFVWAFLRRRSRFGSLAFGFTGPLLGQIHMPGFYFFLGITAVLVSVDRRSVRWRAWISGALLGAVPMLPWISYLIREPVARGGVHLSALLDFSFWMNWFDQATGTDFSFRFGAAIRSFQATRLIMTLQAICSIIGVTAAIAALQKLGKRWQEQGIREALLPEVWKDEGLLLWGGGLGFGILLTLSGFRIYPHYLLAAFPLIPLSLTLAFAGSMRRRSRAVLGALVLSQLITTALLREHLHVSGGSPDSDHGVVYSRQGGNVER